MAQQLGGWLNGLLTPVYGREAALGAPAIPILVGIGFATGQLGAAAIAAGAAFSVGFGAARDLAGWRWAAMFTAAAGLPLATFIGCTTAEWFPGFVMVVGLSAAACGWLALVEEDLWWVVLQLVIALLVAGHYPSPAKQALQRAGVVLLGGGAQIATVMVLARLFPGAARRLPAGPPPEPPSRTLLIGHAVRSTVAVAIALVLAKSFGLANSYWAPMTALLVLKPGLSATQARGLERVTGTLIGCLLATGFVMVVGDQPVAMILALTISVGAAFALQKAHYAILTGAVTATIVLLLTLAVGHAMLNAEHRLIATVLGGAVALIVARIAPQKPKPVGPSQDRVGIGQPAV